MEKHKELKTLNMNTMKFNPEFLRMIRPIFHEKFKHMSLEYDQSYGMDFNCRNMLLTSLEGAPQSVNGGFACSNNQLTSLKGAPQYVGLSFYCDHNPRLSEAQITHYKEFLKGQHQECLVDGHYMPPERLK